MSLLKQLGEWAERGLDTMQEICNRLEDVHTQLEDIGELLQDILNAVEAHSYHYEPPKKEKKK